jgi:hypothetical protein
MSSRLRYGLRLGGATLVGVLLAMSESACDSGTEPSPIPAPGNFEAQLRGAREWSYRGTASFYTGVFEDGRPQFSFWSNGLDGSAGSYIGFQAVLLGVPPVGTYQIVPQRFERPSEGLFIAAYNWWPTLEQNGYDYEGAPPGSRVGEAYVARSGSLNITFSSEDRIEGRFRMEVVLFCSFFRLQEGDSDGVGPCVPWEVEDGAPTVEVNGAFNVVPDDSEVTPVVG